MSGFSWNFQDMLTMTQETIWNILGMIGLTPWTQGSFFYFLGPCLLATSHNTGWMDIHEIFRIWTQEVIGYTVSPLSRLFHDLQTRRGRGLRSRSASCFIYFLTVFSFIYNLFFVPRGPVSICSLLPTWWHHWLLRGTHRHPKICPVPHRPASEPSQSYL